MGDYAQDAIEAGMDEVAYDGWYSIKPRRKKEKKYHHYTVNQVIKETEKAVLVQFKNEEDSGHKYAGKPWSHAFWFPLSQVSLYNILDEKMIMVPDWLIDIQFERGGVEIEQQQTRKESE